MRSRFTKSLQRFSVACQERKSSCHRRTLLAITATAESSARSKQTRVLYTSWIRVSCSCPSQQHMSRSRIFRWLPCPVLVARFLPAGHLTSQSAWREDWGSTNSAISIGIPHALCCKVTSFTNIVYSEEQQPLEEFFKAKNIRIKNEMVDDVSILNPCLAIQRV